MRTFAEYFSCTLRFIAGATVAFLTPLAMAQSGFVSLGGFTHTTDNVGIGITDPATSNAKLHVLSTSSNVLALYPPNSGGMGMIVTSALQSEGVPWGVSLQLTSVSNINVSGMQLGSAGAPIIESLGGYPLRLNSSGVLGFTPGDVIVGDAGLGNGLRVNSSGNSSFAGSVGIGTASPSSKLQVTGGSAFITGDSGALAAGAGAGLALKETSNGAEIFGYDYGTGVSKALILQSPGGNVGIGPTAPTRPLSFANVTGEKISLYSSSTAPHDYYGFGIAGAELQYQATVGAHHSFYVGATEMVRIDTSGNLGVGAFSPNYKLDVNGTGHFAGAVTVSGTLTATTVYANYQDVAEWVPATESMPAGTVAVLSASANNTVAPSMHAYDTGVAGVVSSAPGLLLGVESASKAKIATTGRVKVRVNATKQPIRIGDLLVTSDRPGMAMKSEPLDIAGVKLHRPGTLIGKALEPLAGGQGEILVLLSLQ
jgi:hypothetical protein